jgi:ADP-ribosyl-[dinitrogen reductase] hydrolase
MSHTHALHTSQTDPLRIAVVPAAGGEIGLSFCPGKHAPRFDGGRWRRDLDADLAQIRDWGAGSVVTLIEDHEFGALCVTALPQRVQQLGMAWHHLPIPDGGVPGAGFALRWQYSGLALRQALQRGDRIFVHCRGGLGRAGMVSARLLVELGETAASAIARVRAARPGAIENRAQESWVDSGL